jgi:sporulation protein YlmC with PRC-barrel domain
MQHCLCSMIGYTIQAADGDLGRVDDFYLDDTTWTIRYMVAETGNWLLERKVLVSLFAWCKPEWKLQMFLVNLTKEQVRHSPDIDTNRLVSRQHEIKLHEYYQWPRYWEGGFGVPVFENSLFQETFISERLNDPHLRSTRQIVNYHIHATDGEIGHIEDFIVDDRNWAIHFLIVNTKKWLSGKIVLIPPKWIKNINWADASVHLDRSREEVKNSPDFDPSEIIHHNYEKDW